MNGTAVMTALACLAFDRANYLAKLASRITALSSLALKGNSHHFDEILFSVKPHPGQQQVAKWIRDDLNHHDHPRNADRLQDRYSIRCAPHVIGVLQDSLPFFRQMIENELNSANDNPIIDGEGEHVLHGGHFYGGHIAMAMDSMKNGDCKSGRFSRQANRFNWSILNLIMDYHQIYQTVRLNVVT